MASSIEITPQRMRDVANYHIGTDLLGRLAEAIEYQELQRATLDSAAALVDTLRAEITGLRERLATLEEGRQWQSEK